MAARSAAGAVVNAYNTINKGLASGAIELMGEGVKRRRKMGGGKKDRREESAMMAYRTKRQGQRCNGTQLPLYLDLNLREIFDESKNAQ